MIFFWKDELKELEIRLSQLEDEYNRYTKESEDIKQKVGRFEAKLKRAQTIYQSLYQEGLRWESESDVNFFHKIWIFFFISSKIFF